jgi:mannose-6-phosphate isomerase-like protein (cupin superfamily)
MVLGSGASGLLVSKASAPPLAPGAVSIESDRENIRRYDNIHRGLGTVGVRLFDFGGAPSPANFLIYEIPPGASEGLHVHNLIDPALGAYDEYYLILEGHGEMLLAGRTIPVGPGDHVHTPLEIEHGIANPHDGVMLRVFLTYIDRAPRIRRRSSTEVRWPRP